MIPGTFKHTDHPTWRRWCSFRNMINNPKNFTYRYYGGRGIKYDPRWDDFEVFVADLDSTIGSEPPFEGAHLDRIDNDGDYYLENMQWTTPRQNYNNRRSNEIIEYNGQRMSIADWARHVGINHKTIWSRLFDHGYTIGQALGFEPKK